MHRHRRCHPGGSHWGAVSYAQQAASGKPINWGGVAGAAATGAIIGGVAGAVGPVAIAGAWGFGGGAAVLAATTSVVATDAVGVGLTAGGVVGGVAGIAAGDAADCGLSFRADTLIATPKGNQAISTLKAG